MGEINGRMHIKKQIKLDAWIIWWGKLPVSWIINACKEAEAEEKSENIVVEFYE